MSGLQVPEGGLGIGHEAQQAIHNAWDTFDNIEQALIQAGFPPMATPGTERPTISGQTLTNATGTQLTEIMASTRAWHTYSSNLLSRIKARLVQVDYESGLIVVDLKAQLKQVHQQKGLKKPTGEELESAYKTNERWRQLLHEKLQLEQQKLMLEPHVEALYQDGKMISRYIELRRQELESLPSKSPGRIP